MATPSSRVDKILQWWADRRAFYQSYLESKTHRLPALPITSATVDSQSPLWGTPPDDLRARISMTLSWIYSDIEILGNEVSSAVLHVLRKEGENENAIIDHPAEALFLSPN